MLKRAVVIGGNAAGLSVASQVKRRKPEWEVVVFEKGDYISYGACGLPYYVEGLVPQVDNLITLTPEDAIHKRQLDLRMGYNVTDLYPRENRIEVETPEGEESWGYDYLAVCTGASATLRGIKVQGSRGIFTINEMGDALKIDQYFQENSPQSVAVIGGGFIAVEMAEAFLHRGLETHLIHRRENLAKSLEPELSSSLLEKMEQQGVVLKMEHPVERLEETSSGVAVNTEKGTFVYDMVLVATGVAPNTSILEKTGIELGVNGAVATDPCMRTNYENIYAAGDCTQALNLLTRDPVFVPLALKANREGFVAGSNMGGGKEEFPGVLETGITKFFEWGVARTGLTLEGAEKAGYQAHKTEVTTGSRAHYYPGSGRMQTFLVVDRSSKKLLGAQLFGPWDAVKRIDVYVAAITAGMTVEEIFNLDLAYAPPYSPVYDPIITAARIARKG